MVTRPNFLTHSKGHLPWYVGCKHFSQIIVTALVNSKRQKLYGSWMPSWAATLPAPAERTILPCSSPKDGWVIMISYMLTCCFSNMFLPHYTESCLYSELWFLCVGMVPVRPYCGLLPELGFSGFCLWDHIYSQMAWHNALENEIGFGQEAASSTYREVPKLIRSLAFLLKWKEMKMNSIQIIGLMICFLVGWILSHL